MKVMVHLLDPKGNFKSKQLTDTYRWQMLWHVVAVCMPLWLVSILAAKLFGNLTLVDGQWTVENKSCFQINVVYSSA